MIVRQAVLVCSVFCCGTVFGQAVTVPIQNWSYQNHASTAAEGMLNGQARVIDAIGQANYLNSVAAVNYQEARSKWIDNNKKWISTYYANKIYNKEMRDRYAKKPPTREQWDRITLASLPDPLTQQQYDRETGRIVWPHVLRTAEYDAFRKRIDELVSNRTADNDGDGSPFQREVATLLNGMVMLLQTNIHTLTQTQYADARAFLKSLDYEVKKVRAVSTAVAPIDNSASIN